MLNTVVLFLFSTCLVEFAKSDATGSPLLTEETFPDAIKEKPHFIMFFAPWCGHCTKLAPIWNELHESSFERAKGNAVGIARVDCTDQTSLCAKHGITGYPTLLYIKSDGTSSRYKGSRSLSELMLYVNTESSDEQTGTKVKSTLPVDHTEALFSSTIAKGHHFIKFFAPWCGHCKQLAPIWDKLAEAFSKNDDVLIGKVDCTEHRSVCTDNGIKGYPTLLWFTDGVQVGDRYSGERSLEALRSFTERQLAEGKATATGADDDSTLSPPERSSPVTVLTEEDFSASVGRANQFTFVKFFTPWCGHCKKMATAYIELAKQLQGKADLDIAEVDCTEQKQLCADQQVAGFPTIVLYRAGAVVQEYSGDRSTGNMLKFVMEHSQKEEL